MGLTGAVKLWLLIKPIKRIKEFRNKETKMFKGRLTYASLAVVLAPLVGRLFGFEATDLPSIQYPQDSTDVTELLSDSPSQCSPNHYCRGYCYISCNG